ncbi:exonuclease domain-containing protein [Mesorhizobium sp. ASY16-5R]|uniref:exonuclease domain-containing protein n=1 Tax=Mesorhizobium sp. ASY16-5R TaxID=3445772 RepID=UPI003FA1128A
MAFVVYDCETSGADKRFDQILQFAAVLTDDDLNIVDQFEIRSRLLPHIVPSPGAMIVTGMHVDQLVDALAPSHFEMCKKIRQVLSVWSPATVVGYNSLRFDEEFLRQAFYSSLLPIYLTNTGGNSRLDALTLVLATRLYRPEALNWPLDEEGKVRFKLDRLAPANGCAHDNAHDALADVRATVHLIRLIKERAPDVWAAAIAYRTKAAATNYVKQEKVFVASRLRPGAQSSTLVTALAANPDQASEVFVFDLQFDPAVLTTMSDDELTELFAGTPRPVTSIRLNTCPLFMPVETVGSLAPGYRLGMDELVRRAMSVRSDAGLRQRLIRGALAGRTPFPESAHVEDQIYAGFYNRADQALIDEFHKSEWIRRFELAGSFADQRLRTLARRLVYCEAPDILPAGERERYARAIGVRISGNDGVDRGWTTLHQAIEEARRLLQDPATYEKSFIQEHLDHLTGRLEEAHALLDPRRLA